MGKLYLHLIMLRYRETAPAGQLFGCIAGLLHSHCPMGSQSPELGDCAALLRRPGHCTVDMPACRAIVANDIVAQFAPSPIIHNNRWFTFNRDSVCYRAATSVRVNDSDSGLVRNRM